MLGSKMHGLPSSYAKEIDPAWLQEKWRLLVYDTNMTDIKKKNNHSSQFKFCWLGFKCKCA